MTDFLLGMFCKKTSKCYPLHIGQLCYITFEFCSQIKKFMSGGMHAGQMLCDL